jgi:hypothetical protein
MSSLRAMATTSTEFPTGYLTEPEVLRALRVVKPKKFGELRRKGLIPYVLLGHRSYIYDLDEVRRALKKLTINR